MNFKTKNGTKRIFPYETKASIHVSQWVEWICGVQSLKERRLLFESMFIPIEGRTLILEKEEKKVFLWNQSIKFIYPNE